MARWICAALYCLFLFTWLVDLNSSTILPWLAPDFVARANANANALEEIRQTPLWELVERDYDSDSIQQTIDVGTQMLALNEEYQAWTFRSGAIRFVATPVSPASHGPLTDKTTWRNWFQHVGSMIGVGKTLMIASFYFGTLFVVLRFSSWFTKTKNSDEGNIEPEDAGLFFWGPVYAVVGAVIFPIVTCLANAAAAVESPVWRIVAVIFVGIIRLIAGIVDLIGAKLIGTLILIVALPFSLFHGVVTWLIPLFF